MAEYKKSCTGTGSGFLGQTTFTLRLVLTESDISSSNNTSKLKYKLYLDTTYGRFEDWGLYYSMTVTNDVDSKTSTVFDVTGDVRDMPSTRGASLLIKEGDVGTFKHGTDGRSNISFTVKFYGSSGSYNPGSATISDKIALTKITLYKLSVSEGAGSSISVNRTSSGGGSTGVIKSGALLYTNDKLTITFTPSTNYSIGTHTVNGSTFTSGNTHTVSGDVSVVSTGTPLSSKVGATDSYVGSASTITITKYSDSYYHSLMYSFCGSSGYIKSDGSTSSTESKFSGTSVAFSVPTSFYELMQDRTEAECTITCTTYQSSTSTNRLGNTTTCKFVVRVSQSSSSPIVSGSVVDVNQTSVKLTGDDSVLIRYISSAKCKINTTYRNGSSKDTEAINGITPSANGEVTISGDNLASGTFVFYAKDSRGYESTYTTTKTVVEYIRLTIAPLIRRTTQTDGKISLEFKGNYYNGSFGAYRNTLKIQYRYREKSAPSWSSWITVNNSNYIITSSGYQTDTPIQLLDTNGRDDTFNYLSSYVVQIQATDGAANTVLSTANSGDILIQPGVPVYDWSKNDFRVHVPASFDERVDMKNGFKINNKPVDDIVERNSILDMVYPVGSIYMSVNSTSPQSFIGGTWERIKGKFLFAGDDTDDPKVGTTGGSSTHTLTTSEMPSHTHGAGTLKNADNGSHTHYVGRGAPNRAMDGSDWYTAGYNSSDTSRSSSSSAGSHSHTISGNTGSNGSGTSFSIMPPYLAVYVWKRVS